MNVQDAAYFTASDLAGAHEDNVTDQLIRSIHLVNAVNNLVADHYPQQLNRDLLLMGAFLHDLGKLLWIIRGTMLVFLTIHVWTGIRLYLQNWSARPISYNRQEYVETGLTSRTMIWSGLGIFSYVVYHLLHFTFITTNPEYATLTDAVGRFDVYSMVILGFQNYLISAAYLVCMFALAFHINHALPSLLQTLGLTRPEYRTILKRVGNLAAIFFFVGYASMPVAVLLNLIKLPGGN